MIIKFKNLNNLTGWLVWLIATVTYFITIEPSVSFWDCGEYVACANKLEVAHPPGAPFFLLLGRIFSLFAGNDSTKVAMMINLMSALSSSFTILFLFWTISRLGIKSFKKNVSELQLGQQLAVIGASFVGALAFTFSDTFWFNAVEGEVYALSSFFTAIIFWSILKWEEEDTYNSISAIRWLVLISFLLGLSTGIHLLNLLVIPAIVFVIYFKKYSFSWKGFFIVGILSVLILGVVQNLVIIKSIKIISEFDILFTNNLHLGYNTGIVIFLLLVISLIAFFILYSVTKKLLFYNIALITTIIFSVLAIFSALNNVGIYSRLIIFAIAIFSIYKLKYNTFKLNTIFISLAVFFIGFSTFFVLLVRSQANTPIDENNVENASNMASYLARESFGEAPLLYGQYYNAPTLSYKEFGNGEPIYAKDKTKNNYRIVDSLKNSVTKYNPDFYTFFPRMYASGPYNIECYQYWGDVANNHKNKIIINAKGDTSSYEIPTMRANLNYFFKYQLNFMYWRYFMWNFVGRQNDGQGIKQNNLQGNWLSGVKYLDDFRLGSDTSEQIHKYKYNFATNHFFALPFLLGLLGIWFHFKRSKVDAWIIMCLFLLTGIAIIVYLNQTPGYGREGDYAYVGSFYAFAIWIGLGVMFIFNVISRKLPKVASASIATAFSLVVPAIMLQQGWNDHNRSKRTLAHNLAVNYLQSCAPNAILFTSGDNDTFPLWYAQEVEGIRTDVRVCNLSLLMTDWYIKQMKSKVYLSEPVPFTIPDNKLEASKLELAYYTGKEGNELTNIKEVIKFITSADTSNKIKARGKVFDVLPTRNFYVNVDSFKVMKNKVINVKDTNRLTKRILWDIGEKPYLLKNELMVLDLISNNDWKRPIYFATSNSDESFVGLKKYCQLEGLAYRFVPIKQTETEEALGGRVNTEIMYNNIMQKFSWGGINKKEVYLDENCILIANGIRAQMIELSEALINEGNNKKAKIILDKCIYEMPDEKVPYDAIIFRICSAYYKLNEYKIANDLSKKLFDIFESDLYIYLNQKKSLNVDYIYQVNEAKEILNRLTDLTQQFKQTNLNNEFVKRLKKQNIK